MKPWKRWPFFSSLHSSKILKFDSICNSHLPFKLVTQRRKLNFQTCCSTLGQDSRMHKKGKDKTVLHVKQVNSVLDTVKLLIEIVLCLLLISQHPMVYFWKKICVSLDMILILCFWTRPLPSLALNVRWSEGQDYGWKHETIMGVDL